MLEIPAGDICSNNMFAPTPVTHFTKQDAALASRYWSARDNYLYRAAPPSHTAESIVAHIAGTAAGKASGSSEDDPQQIGPFEQEQVQADGGNDRAPEPKACTVRLHCQCHCSVFASSDVPSVNSLIIASFADRRGSQRVHSEYECCTDADVAKDRAAVSDARANAP